MSLIPLLAIILSGCSLIPDTGGTNNTVSTGDTTPMYATLSGVVSVPTGTPANAIASLRTLKASSEAAPLKGAKVKIYNMGKDGSLTEALAEEAVTDDNGAFQIKTPKGNNLIVLAKKEVTDGGIGKDIVTKNFVSIKDADLGGTKGLNLDAPSTLAVAVIKDKIKSQNQGVAEGLKVSASDIPTEQVEEVKTVFASHSTEINEHSESVDIVSRPQGEDAAIYETEMNVLIESLMAQIATLKTELQAVLDELEAKIDELLNMGIIAGEIKDTANNLLVNVTVTVTDGGMANAVTFYSNSSGQYVARVPGATTAFKVMASLSGYNDEERGTVFVSAGTVSVVNFLMTPVQTTGGTTTDDTGLTNGGTGDTGGTTSDTTAPTAPTGLAANAVSASQIDLSWTASTDDVGVTIYGIYRDDVYLNATASASYSDTGLVNSTEYCYAVSAFDAAGNESAKSGAACATTQAINTGGTWTTKASMPTARGTHTAVVNGVIYAVGGSYGSVWPVTFVSTVEAYDPATDTWTTKAPMPTARVASTATVNGVIYAIGGADSTHYLSTVEAYDPSTDTWTTKASMPTVRFAITAVVNGVIYAIGGGNGQVILPTVEAYDPATNTWTTKASMPTARESFAAAVVNGVIYTIGGNNNFSTVEAYDPLTNTWTAKAPMPTARALGAGNAVVNNMIYAIGGGNPTGYLSTVEAYNPYTNTWTTNKTPMPTARAASTDAVNGVVYAIGGGTDSTQNHVLSTVEAYTP